MNHTKQQYQRKYIMTHNYIISIAGNTTIHFDAKTGLVSTLGNSNFYRTSRFTSIEAAEKYAHGLINDLRHNPAVSKQELQYVTSRPFTICEFSRNLCVNCKEARVHKPGVNRCLRCSYM